MIARTFTRRPAICAGAAHSIAGASAPVLASYDRNSIVAAAAPTSSPSNSAGYSRSSWRTAILKDQPQQPEEQPAGGDSASVPAPANSPDCSFSSRSSRDDASDGSDSTAAGGGDALNAAELRVRLSLAASSGRLDLTDCRLSELPAGVMELTELEELQLSGNCLTQLPDSLSRLTGLRRLGLAGNLLTCLPPSLGALTALEGLWLHGNLLTSLPPDMGRLRALRALSLAGNCLDSIPPGCLSGMTSLTDLTLAGNRLRTLPPGELAPLSRLRKLALNGNQLGAGLGAGNEGLQLGLGRHMTALAELMLQGNCLEVVEPAVFECPALTELSLADNRLISLPPRLAAATSLARLHLFGNRLTNLPARQLAALPALSSVWLEGNPLEGGAVVELLALAGAGGMPRLKALGLDQEQLATAGDGVPAVPSNVRVGCVLGSGPGYFKLQYGPQRPGGQNAEDRRDGSAEAGMEAEDMGDGSLGRSVRSSNELLLVAFGSAPGTPNWGGLLSRVYRAASSDSERYFDVLYVADPARDWYGGGDDTLHAYYHSRLSSYTAHYRRVLLLGDSMGATVALLFADMATAVLAFCPQVDLSLASIRPGRPAAWLARLHGRLLDSVRSSDGQLEVLVGTWQHDLAQANILPQQGQRPAQSNSSLEESGSQSGTGGRRLANRGWRGVVEGDPPTSASAVSRPLGAAARRSPWSWQQNEDQEGGATPLQGTSSSAEQLRAGCGVHVRVFSVDSHRLAAALDARGQLVAVVRDAVLHQLGVRSGNVRVSNIL